MEQRIAFARSKDRTTIAYALAGEGPPLPATAGLRRLAPQLDIPITVRNPFTTEVSSADALAARRAYLNDAKH